MFFTCRYTEYLDECQIKQIYCLTCRYTRCRLYADVFVEHTDFMWYVVVGTNSNLLLLGICVLVWYKARITRFLGVPEKTQKSFLGSNIST